MTILGVSIGNPEYPDDYLEFWDDDDAWLEDEYEVRYDSHDEDQWDYEGQDDEGWPYPDDDDEEEF